MHCIHWRSWVSASETLFWTWWFQSLIWNSFHLFFADGLFHVVSRMSIFSCPSAARIMINLWSANPLTASSTTSTLNLASWHWFTERTIIMNFPWPLNLCHFSLLLLVCFSKYWWISDWSPDSWLIIWICFTVSLIACRPTASCLMLSGKKTQQKRRR